MNNKKKIVIVNGYLDIGGAEKVLTYLANVLSEQYEVTFAVLQVSKNELFDLNDKVKLCLLNLEENRKSIKQMGIVGAIKYYLNTANIIREFVKEENADAVIAFNDREVFLSWWALRRDKKIKLIFSQRNAPISKPKRTNMMLKYIYKHCDGVVFQLKEVQEYYGICDDKKSIIIENPVELREKQIWKANKEKRIIAAGRLTQQKRFDILIKAFSKFHKEKPNYILDIYGKGVLGDELQQIIYDEELENSVHIIAPISKVMEKNNNAEMFVLSSDYEGIPNVLIEAMSEGIPCIATDCLPGGARMVTNGGKCALLVERENVDALYDAMMKYSDNEQLQSEMVNNAYEYIQRFSNNTISNKWLNFLDRIVSD